MRHQQLSGSELELEQNTRSAVEKPNLVQTCTEESQDKSAPRSGKDGRLGESNESSQVSEYFVAQGEDDGMLLSDEINNMGFDDEMQGL